MQYRRIMEVDKTGNGDGADLKTERILLNLGPQHPSTHGVFRMVVALDGENVVGLEPVMGYLHRNHEKIGERNTYIMNMPFTDRLDYISSPCRNNFGYALAVEKLMARGPGARPRRVIRVMMAELTRVDQPSVGDRLPVERPGRVLHPGTVRLRRARTDPRLLRGGGGQPYDVQLHALRRRVADLPEGLRVERSATIVRDGTAWKI